MKQHYTYYTFVDGLLNFYARIIKFKTPNHFLSFALFCLLTVGSLFGQTAGDFRSAGNGNWTAIGSWETYNGTVWLPATSYPGQNVPPPTPNVEILGVHTITINTNLTTQALNSVTVVGNLVLSPPNPANLITLNTQTLNISGGNVNFALVKTRLDLPSGAVITIDSGGSLTATTCNNNNEIYIGTRKYAACVGSPGGVYTFGEVSTAGGNVNANITIPVSGPVAVSGCTTINLTGKYDGTFAGPVNYTWTFTNPSGTTTGIGSGSLANTSATTSTSFNATTTGTYTAYLEVTNGTFTNVESRTFNVTDTTPPTITCPANININTDAGLCTAVANFSTPSGADDCGAVTVTQIAGPVSGSAFPVGTTTVTFRAQDTAGNTAQCSFTVTVTDNQDPVISCPSNITVNAAAGLCNANVTVPLATATDNCTVASITNDFNGGGANASGTYPVGTTTITFTATDSAGRTDSCSMTVTVTDNQDPVISCPSNITVNAAAGLCNANVTVPLATATDNCTGTTITNDFNGGGANASGTYPVGTTTVTFTATDSAGRTDSCSMTVTVNDNQDPVISCPANITVNAAAGLCNANVTVPLATATDNCTVASITNDFNGGGANASGTYPVGTTTVTFTATDSAGRTDSCSMTVTVTDNQDPVISCPSNITVNAAAGLCNANVTVPLATATDNCTVASITNDFNGGGANASGTYPVGTTTVTFTATDSAGRTDSCSMTVTVTDNQDPVISCPSNITVNAAAGLCNANVTVPLATATDNCTVASITNDFNGGGANASGTYPVGTTTVTFTATDSAGRTDSCSMTVTVTDNQDPVISCPSNITVNAAAGLCNANVTVPLATATDNCTGTTITNDFNGGGANASGTYPVGTTTVTFTATDSAGRTDSCSMTVTVTDNQDPVISCPSNITVNAAAGLCNANVTVPLATATDNCTGTTITNDFNGGGANASGTYPVGTTTVTFTATDSAGRTDSCSMTVTVTDNQDPVISCPSNITVNAAAGLCNANVTVPLATATDNCTGTTITNDFNGGGANASGTYPVGTTTVTFTATDSAGRTDSCSMTVTVTDNQDPVISCPANITVNAAAGLCNANVTVPLATATDNCTVASITNDFNGGGANASGTYPVGTTTVTFTATDSAGRTDSCSMTVTVTDNQDPVISCPANITVNAAAGLCNANVTVPLATATDNCTVASITNDFNGGGANASGTYPVGTTTVTFTATDSAGRTDSCSMTVTVTDNQDPVISCPSNITVNAAAGLCNANVTVPLATATDNCTGTTITNDFNGGGANASGTYPVGTTTVTFTATDSAGRTDSCSMTVTVTDNQDPVISCPSNITVNAAAGLCNANVTVPLATATDNCTGTTITNDFNGGGANASGTYPVGTTTVTFTATDSAGRTDSCSMTVTVTDNQDPVISCPSNITVNAAAGLCNANVTVPLATATDNCTGTTITNDFNGGGANASGTYPVGTTTVTFTATDSAGRTDSCSMTVTVTDNQDPVISCPANITVNAAAGLCNANVTVPLATATDNCTGTTITNDFNGGGANASGTYPVGTTTVTFTATDSAGRTDSCSMTVTVTDNQDPVISCPANITVNAAAGLCNANVTVPLATATDNCTGTTITNDFNGGGANASGTYPVGTTTVTFTATDSAGRTDSCSMTVTVTDNQDPVISCPSDINLNVDAGNCSAVATFATPAGADNCGVASVTQTAGPVSGSAFPVGTTVVTFRVTDTAGLTTDCSFNVNVTDNEPPSITCPSNITVTNTPSTCSVVVNYTTPTGTDNCSGANTVQTAGLASGSAFPVGTTTNTFVVTDAAGNTATCSFDVTVIDAAASATVSITASPSTTICQGTSVTFTPTPSNGGTYEWFVNNVSQGVSPTFTSTTLNNADAVRAVMTSNLSACNTTVNSNVVNMTVNALRNVSFTINGPSTICAGESVTFTPSGITNGGANPTYQWKVNGANTATTQNFTTSSLNNGDVVTLEVTSYVQCASPVPATSSNSITVTVNALPTLSTSNGSVCANSQSSIDLNTLVSTNGTTVTFHTTQANANNDTGAISATVSPTSATTYYVRSEFGTGCYVTDTINITIDPLPTVNAGPDQSICVGDSFNLSTIASGSGTLSYYTTQNDANNGTNAIGATVSPSSTTPYFVRSENAGTGCYATDSVIINVNPILTPSVSISASATSICSGTNVTFTATPTNGGSTPVYTWYVGATAVGNGPTYSSTTLVNGNVVTVQMATSEPCNDNALVTSNAISMTVYTTPAVPSAITGPSGVCPPSYGLVYSVTNNPNIQTYNWTFPAGFTITSGAGTNSVTVDYVNNLNQTNVPIRVTATNLCGTSTYSELLVSTDTFLYVNAGPDQYVCAGTTSVQLAGQIGGVITRKQQWDWEALTPGGSFSNPDSVTSNYTLPGSVGPGGSVTIRIFSTINNTNNTCSGNVEDFMTIYVLPVPTASISGATTLCAGQSTNITFTGTQNSTVTYQVNGGPNQTIAIGGSGIATLTTPALSTTTTYSLLSVSHNANPSCSQGVSGNAVVTVNPVATVNAGVDFAICEGSTATMAGSFGGGASSSTWTSSSGGSFSNNSPTAVYTPNATDIANGTVTITYTTNDPSGPCPSVSDSMVLTINQAPTINAGPDFTICEGSTATMAASLGGSATSGTWSSSGGGSFSNNSTTAVYTPNATDIANGAVTLTYTSNDPSGVCSAVNDAMVLTINPAAVVDAGLNQTICSNETATMSATLSGSATSGTWTSSGTGSFSNNSTTAVYTPSANDINNGSVILTYTTNDPAGICPATNDTMTLTIRDEIIIYTEPENVGICENNATSLSVVAAGDDLSYQWYFNGGSGYVPTGTNSNILNFPSASLTDAGSYYVVISNSAGDCPSVTSQTVTLNVNENISIDVSSQPASGIRCENDSYTFTVDANGTIDSWQWYKINSPSDIAISGANGTGSTATLNLTNLLPTDAGDYYVVFSGPPIGNCGSVSSLTGNLVVHPLPTVNAGPDQTICSNNSASLNATIGGSASTGTWTSSSGNSGGFSAINSTNSSYTPSATDISNGTVTLTFTTTNATSPCGNVNDSMVLTIEPLPTATISYSSSAYCESDIATYSVTLNQTNGASGTYSYAVNSGGPTLNINSSTGLITPNGSSIGTYTVVYTIPASAYCGQVTATFNVEIEAEPDATFSYASAQYCENGTDPTPNVNETGGTFSSSPAGLVINSSTGTIDLDASTIGTYTVYYTFGAITNGCGQVQSSQTITIDPDLANALLDGFAYDQTTPPSPGPISSQILACHEGDGTLTLHIDPSYIPYIQEWQYNNGSGFITAPSDGDPDNNILTYDFTGLIGVTSYRVVFNTGSTCGNAGYSSVAYVSVIPPDLKPEPVIASPTEFCYGDSSTMTASTNYGAEQLNSEGLFQTGQINTQDPDSWLVDGAVRGLSAAGNNLKDNNWSGTNPHPLTVAGIGPINWSSGEPKFAIAGGVLNQNQTNDPYYYEGGVAMTTLTTPIFSLMTLQDAILTFDEAFILAGAQTCTGPSGSPVNYPAGQAIIQISTNGGSTWNNIPDDQVVDNAWRTGAVVTGTSPTPVNSGNLTNFNVNTTTLDLSSYFGNTDMRIRFVLVRNCESVWALDNIELPGAAGGSTIEWTDQFGMFISNDNTIVHTPITPGAQIYTVTTYINGCRSLAPEGSEDVLLTVDMAYAGVDQTVVGCGNAAQLHAYDNTKKSRRNWTELVASGNWTPGLYTLPSGPAFDYDGTGALGEWSITSGPAVVGINWATEDPADYFFPSPTDPRAEFAGPGGQYTLTWTVHGAGGDCSDSVVVNLSSCSTLDFDGIDDNVTFRNDYHLNSGPFSIEIWVKPDPTREDGGVNNFTQTILSKRDGSNLVHGYDLRLQNNKIHFNWNNGGTLTHSNTIGTDRWYHVAVTFNGSNTYKMYIDGIELGSTTSGAAPIGNTFECIMGAMDRSAGGGNPTPINYFSGWLDELRIWNRELSVEQIRHMMNQEIIDNAGNVRGEVIPIDIPGPPSALTWANLNGYYRMNQADGDIAGGYLLANAGTRDGQMRNITTWQLENSPLPYETDNTGNWYNTASDVSSPWRWGHTVWDYPNALGIDGTTRIDWNIVRTSHNVDSDLTSASPRDITLLGLVVNPSSQLTITAQGTQDENNTGHGLWVTHYLELDGIIDLVGESQLVQKRYSSTQVNESMLNPTSGGYIERDQQGTSNYHNYNYLSSFVNPINTSANNTPYNVATVLMDGTTSASPINLQWTSSYDAPLSTPKTISRRWIWAYENYVTNTYANWSYKQETATIAAGLGFTMKGSGYSTYNGTNPLQNYVFRGKPNNADITNPLILGNDALVGNPYSSAIDADAFLIDNGPSGTGSINGALYFWEHYPANQTHILRDYQGGYAVYNFSGGIAAVTPPPTSDGVIIIGGAGTKIPGRYIPVGQGFFVTAADDAYGSGGNGGNVLFQNSQRVFVRETNDNSANGSTFIRSKGGTDKGKPKGKGEKSNSEDDIKRVRLTFKTPEGATRPLLLGFVPNGLATDGVDYGYDALNFETFPNDLNWMINGDRYVIQGVGDFVKTKQYPLGMFLTSNGNIEIELTELENFENPIDVYIYDALLGTYTRFNDVNYQISLDANDYLNRFYIAFQDNSGTLSVEDEEAQNILVNYLNSTDEIYVKTINSVDVRQIYLINMLGQTVKSWNMTNLPMANNEIRIPVSKISEGNYILKVETSRATVNKKVIIKF
ncbi:HYR domain-containing protein [Flavobacteriaceae bacterium MAR_2010_105]|nr:HYR domain-containing protein [Flavobacteriaceae bacterium MAR_2010_105]